MKSLIDILYGNLLSVSLQVTILIALIGLVSLCVKKASSEFRYWLWLIVLFWLCIPVGFNLPFLPSLDSGNLIRTNYSRIYEPVEKQPVTVDNSLNTTVMGLKTNNDKISVSSTTGKSDKINFKEILVLLWFSGVLLITTITVWRNIRIFNKLKKCPAVEREDLNVLLGNLCRRLGITKKVRLHYMDLSVVSGPAASGIIRPKVFLPPAIADTWSVTDAEPILLHELAHIKRHDSVINIIQVVVQTLYFFHPLVWLVNRKVQALREEVCDDTAIRYLEGEIHLYSTSILSLIGILNNEKSLGLAGFGFTEIKNSLGKRIKRIMNENYRIKNQRMSLTSFTALVLIGFVSIAIASGKKTESLEDIIKIAEKGDYLIQSYKVTTIYIPERDSTEFQKMYEKEKNDIGKSPGRRVITIKVETHFIYKNPKIIIDSKLYGKSFPGNKDILQNTIIYDGNDIYHKEYHSDRFEKSPQDYKRPFIGLTYLRGYYINSTPVSVFLKGSLYGPADKTFLLKNFKQLDDEKLGNISCKVFNAEYFYDDTHNHNITVWLATDMMYRPIKIQLIIKGKDSQNNDLEINETSNITMKNIQGLWVPEFIESQSMQKDFKTNEWKKYPKSTYLFSNFEFNIDIPDSIFVVPEN